MARQDTLNQIIQMLGAVPEMVWQGWLSYVLFGLCLVIWPIVSLRAEERDMVRPRYEIAYATYLGGDRGAGVREAISYPDGSVLIGAQTASTDMPTTPGAVQREYAGDDPALGHPGIYGGDCYLARLSPDGKEVLAATYFGGSKQERNVYGMALDREGNVVITSATRSPDLPTTPGCFRSEYGGADNNDNDGFAAKLTPDLKKVLWCTYLGGCHPRGGLGLDDSDNVYVIGSSNSPKFPTTPGVLQSTPKADATGIIMKLKPDGSGLVFSTFFAGGAIGVRVGPEGDVYIAGSTSSASLPVIEGAPQPELGGESDCFVAKLSRDGRRVIYATYLGGSENEYAEHQLFLNKDKRVLVAGVTTSTDFPTTARAFQRTLKGNVDGFLTKVSADGRSFVCSTLLGGSGDEHLLMMPTADADGNILVVGQTTSSDFPVTAGALQSTYGGGPSDGFLAAFSPDGSELLYATYLGGSGADLVRSVALGPNGEVFLVGGTGSQDFPVTPGALQTRLQDGGAAFVAKLVPAR